MPNLHGWQIMVGLWKCNLTNHYSISSKVKLNQPEDLEEKLALQVGLAYTKEIMPGYVVTVKVKSLKAFQATEIYKKRMENQRLQKQKKQPMIQMQKWLCKVSHFNSC